MSAPLPVNWLGQHNPWNLMPPPTWWLLKLWHHDPELRILPGLTQPVYRIARRTAAMQRVRPVLGHDSETGRMCREGCMPIVSLRPTCAWNDDLFHWLDASDVWARGGPERFCDQIERAEGARDAQRDRAADDELDQRGVSGYAALKLRTGQTTFVHQLSSGDV